MENPLIKIAEEHKAREKEKDRLEEDAIKNCEQAIDKEYKKKVDKFLSDVSKSNSNNSRGTDIHSKIAQIFSKALPRINQKNVYLNDNAVKKYLTELHKRKSKTEINQEIKNYKNNYKLYVGRDFFGEEYKYNSRGWRLEERKLYAFLKSVDITGLIDGKDKKVKAKKYKKFQKFQDILNKYNLGLDNKDRWGDFKIKLECGLTVPCSIDVFEKNDYGRSLELDENIKTVEINKIKLNQGGYIEVLDSEEETITNFSLSHTFEDKNNYEDYEIQNKYILSKIKSEVIEIMKDMSERLNDNTDEQEELLNALNNEFSGEVVLDAIENL